VSVIGALVVNALASMVGLAFMASCVRQSSFRFTAEHGRALIMLAIPMGLYALGLQVLTSLDWWLLNAIARDLSGEVKGLYLAAINVARLPNVMAFAVTAVLLPSLARSRALADRQLVTRSAQGTTLFLILVLLPASGIIAVDAAEFMELLFSERYRNGASFLRVLIFSHGLAFTLLMAGCSMLLAIGRERLAATVTLLLVPAAALAGAALIPRSGAAGAAWAALIALGSGAVAVGVLAGRHLGPLMTGATLWRALAVSASVVALAFWLRLGPDRFLIELGLLVAAYVGLVLLSRVIGVRELKLLFASKRDAAAELEPL
jgi:O-antigen/teichoic acid export membrane protein